MALCGAVAPDHGNPAHSFCSPRALLICFYRKHERYSFTGKFTIWSFESIGGPGRGDKRKTDRRHSDTADTGSKSSHQAWLTFFLIRLFTITRKHEQIITITELQQKQEDFLQSASLFWHMKFEDKVFSPSFLWNAHTHPHTQSQSHKLRAQQCSLSFPQIILHWHLRFGSGFRRDGLMHYLFVDRGIGADRGLSFWGQYDPEGNNMGAAAPAQKHTVLGVQAHYHHPQ